MKDVSVSFLDRIINKEPRPDCKFILISNILRSFVQMQMEQAITLIKHSAIASTSSVSWADLGCGSGLFTQALSNLLAPGSKIYAVDKDLRSFKKVNTGGKIMIEEVEVDFISGSMNIGNLDGILMANSLHFVSDKAAFIGRSRSLFKRQECFLFVEYDTDVPNTWVPHPISFDALRDLFLRLGYSFIQKIHEVPSKFNRRTIYSALITR